MWACCSSSVLLAVINHPRDPSTVKCSVLVIHLPSAARWEVSVPCASSSVAQLLPSQPAGTVWRNGAGDTDCRCGCRKHPGLYWFSLEIMIYLIQLHWKGGAGLLHYLVAFFSNDSPIINTYRFVCGIGITQEYRRCHSDELTWASALSTPSLGEGERQVCLLQGGQNCRGSLLKVGGTLQGYLI